MKLFLSIQIHDDPLFLPVQLEKSVRRAIPEGMFFQVDNFSSPELIRTAMDAVDRAEKITAYIDSRAEVKADMLFPLFRKLVGSKEIAIWLEKGNPGLKIFSGMMKNYQVVKNDEEAVEVAKEFCMG